jgi:CrcB protein
MTRFLWICLGGATGSGARYLVSTWALRALGPGFPWGTLAVNAGGSLAMGFLVELAVGTAALPPTVQAALTTGLLGGFTTYSTFNAETLRYLQAGQLALAAAYLVGTVGSCLLAGLLGIGAARWLAGA